MIHSNHLMRSDFTQGNKEVLNMNDIFTANSNRYENFGTWQWWRFLSNKKIAVATNDLSKAFGWS